MSNEGDSATTATTAKATIARNPSGNGGMVRAQSYKDAAEEAARLDQRIAEKRAEKLKITAAHGANTRTDSRKLVELSNSKDDDSSPQKEETAPQRTPDRIQLRQLEQDVLVKARVAQEGSSPQNSNNKDSSPASSKKDDSPGRSPERIGLRQMEEDVLTKSRTRQQMALSQRDLAAKAGTGAEAGAAAERSSLRMDVGQLENDVLAKSRAQSLRSIFSRSQRDLQGSKVPSSPGGASQPLDRIELGSLEEDVLAKSRAQASQRNLTATAQSDQDAPSMSMRNQLHQLEQQVISKTRQTLVVDPANGDDVPGIVPEEHINNVVFINEHRNGELFLDGTNLPKTGEELDNHSAVSGMDPPTVDRGVIREPDVEFGEVRPPQTLAEATAIVEDDEEELAFLPTAVAYDTSNKPPFDQKRRIRLVGMVAIGLMIVLAIGLSVGITQRSKNKKTAAPTAAPTTYRETMGIQDKIAQIISPEKLYDRQSPHFKALDWIINGDPMQLVADSTNLIQRYLTALLYLSTIEFGPWLSCNPPVEGEDDTCLFNQLLASFPPSYQQVPSTRWLSSTHECKWAGVQCDPKTNQITGFGLDGQQLSGTLPVDIINFENLEMLTLDWNNFIGTLPAEWAQMKYLVLLQLHYNFLTGTIPSSWWNLPNLVIFNVAGNQITGTIPSEVSQLTRLKGFYLFETLMTGTIPTEIGDLPVLSYIRLQRTLLSGTIPTEVGKLDELFELWLHRTRLNGTLPTELGTLSLLEDLRLHFAQFTGTLPSELYTMGHLKRIDLYNNYLSGTISTAIGDLVNLTSFRIRNNDFTGTVPVQFGNLTKLTTLWLSGNRFNGSMPEQVCELKQDENNILEVLEADCASTNGALPEISCPATCCTSCCDANKICQTPL